MKLYWNNEYIAECYRKEDASILIRDYIRKNKIIITHDFYTITEIAPNVIKIDYGDWDNFFYIKELNNV